VQECQGWAWQREAGVVHHRAGAHPPHPSAGPHAASRIGPCAPRGASLSQHCGRPLGVGFFAVSQMASPLSPSRRQQRSTPLSRSALQARDALVLEHLPLADAIASATARRLFPVVEREDLIQVAREALVRSAPRCRAGEPAGPLSAPVHHRRSAAPSARSGAAGAHSPSPPSAGPVPAGALQP